MTDRIRPQDMIKKYGIEGLLQSAENYFRSIRDHNSLLKKPFHDTAEGPYLLCKTGLLLSGLRLGKGMRVLDFGAGSCWLSRFLNELHCVTISIDPSSTALKIGQELFSKLPPLTQPIEPPRFLCFDGKEIPVEDSSVDRIISLDTFHHVPNPDDILEEFFRVLKPGGIIGFAEVGPEHSRSPQSQREMRTFQILENDLVIETLWEKARNIGFSQIYFKHFSHPDLNINYKDYIIISNKKKIPKTVHNHLTDSTRQYPIFFLIKGNYLADSRISEGLSHRLSITPNQLQIPVNMLFTLNINIENSGSSKWLNQSLRDIGTVFIGAHLYDHRGKLIDNDYFRQRLEKPFLPGEKGQQELRLKISRKGRFRLIFDLVSEQVCWFETMGSKPASLNVIAK